MQYLYGLARAGRPEADALGRSLEAHAATVPPWAAAAWQDVCVPACRGLLAHARGDWPAAIEGLGASLPRLLEIGGSHAQRDLFAQLHLDALVHAGHWSAAQNIVQPQLRAQPRSRRLHRLARRIHAGAGLDTLDRPLDP